MPNESILKTSTHQHIKNYVIGKGVKNLLNCYTHRSRRFAIGRPCEMGVFISSGCAANAESRERTGRHLTLQCYSIKPLLVKQPNF